MSCGGRGRAPHLISTEPNAFHLSTRRAHERVWHTNNWSSPNSSGSTPLCRDLWTTLTHLGVISTECLKEPKRQICGKTPSFHPGAKAGIYQESTQWLLLESSGNVDLHEKTNKDHSFVMIFICEDPRASCAVYTCSKAEQSFPFLSQCFCLLRKLFNKVPTYKAWLVGGINGRWFH